MSVILALPILMLYGKGAGTVEPAPPKNGLFLVYWVLLSYLIAPFKDAMRPKILDCDLGWRALASQVDSGTRV